jgi:trans-2,3-dihydro-3-hydroxyanthranilate isomerase
MQFDFLIVDVFSDTPFGGNQLAVLTDAQGLSSEGMQAVAREFNFAETTFVLPATDDSSDRRVRIFTPGGELPFAGHPTVGTACALVMAGAATIGQTVLQEGVGPVRVTVERQGDAYSARLSLEPTLELPDDVPNHAEIAASLSLAVDDVLSAFCGGVGVNFTFVQLSDRAAVDRARLDRQAWSSAFENRWGAQIYLFSGPLQDGAQLYARMYAPGLGIAEDPATGSAVAALAGAAASRARTGATFRVEVTQGVAMGRPSKLSGSASVEEGHVKTVEVGGGCAFVARGAVEVPSHLLK